MSNFNALTEARQGICLHFDESASDAGAVAWLTRDPRAKVSYNTLILDDGTVVDIAPLTHRAWHAGVCRPSDGRFTYRDANSALFGVAIAANSREIATLAQRDTVAAVCRRLFVRQGWNPQTEVWRIVGHDTEAFPRGRKIDPTGSDPRRPVLSVMEIRGMLASGAPARVQPEASPAAVS